MSMLKITLLRSINNAKQKQVATVKALGLRKIGSYVEQKDNEAIRGMIAKVAHLIKVENM